MGSYLVWFASLVRWSEEDWRASQVTSLEVVRTGQKRRFQKKLRFTLDFEFQFSVLIFSFSKLTQKLGKFKFKICSARYVLCVPYSLLVTW